jgi:hypothetical protein
LLNLATRLFTKAAVPLAKSPLMNVIERDKIAALRIEVKIVVAGRYHHVGTGKVQLCQQAVEKPRHIAPVVAASRNKVSAQRHDTYAALTPAKCLRQVSLEFWRSLSPAGAATEPEVCAEM